MSKTPKLDAILKKVAADVIEPTSAPAPAHKGYLEDADLDLPAHERFNVALRRAAAAEGETPNGDLFSRIQKRHDELEAARKAKGLKVAEFASEQGLPPAKLTPVVGKMPDITSTLKRDPQRAASEILAERAKKTMDEISAASEARELASREAGQAAIDTKKPTTAQAATPGILDKAKAIGQKGIDLAVKYPWQTGGIAAGTVLGGVLLHNWLKNKEKKKSRKIAGVYGSLMNAAKRVGNTANNVLKKNPKTTLGIGAGTAGVLAGNEFAKQAPKDAKPAEAPAAEPGMMDKITGFGNQAIDYVKNNPWEAAGIGVGAGLGIYGLYQLLKSKDSDEE